MITNFATSEPETPETEGFLQTNPLAFDRAINFARSLERRLALAQTEIKGHMRVEDELKAENAQFIRDRERANTNERHAASQVIEWSQIATEERHRADQAQVRIAELEKDAARWRKGVSDGEFPIRRSGQWMHVSRTSGRILTGETPEEAIDAALKDRA